MKKNQKKQINNQAIRTSNKKQKKPFKFIKSVSDGGDKAILEIHVKPNARQERLVLTFEELQVAVGVPPSKGKANKAVIDLLSKILEIPARNIQILKGQTSTTKILSCSSIKLEKLIQKFHTLMETY